MRNAFVASSARCIQKARMTKALELMPGDVALGRQGDRLKTLLGSCISVILTDPRRTVGAMCHIVHVSNPNAANQHNTAYGIVAMDEMFHRLQSVGITPQQCVAYVHGGGNMFPNIWNKHHVGATNAKWVLHFLEEHQINVVEKDVGGNVYRKVSWTVGLDRPHVDAEKSE